MISPAQPAILICKTLQMLFPPHLPSQPPPPQSYLSGKDFTTFYKSPAREIIKASGAQQH